MKNTAKYEKAQSAWKKAARDWMASMDQGNQKKTDRLYSKLVKAAVMLHKFDEFGK